MSFMSEVMAKLASYRERGCSGLRREQDKQWAEILLTMILASRIKWLFQLERSNLLAFSPRVGVG